jgi:glutamate racemase
LRLIFETLIARRSRLWHAMRMIGVFDSGHGGLTVLRALLQRFPQQSFIYLGDHHNVPYGNRSSDEIIRFTRASVEALFGLGCRLVVLGCNTATCIAARTLQRDWLPQSEFRGSHNVLGIVAPTVEAATQTPWGLTSPQYPQKYNTDVVAVFGTARTVASDVYREEISKRCPQVTILQQACPDLAGAIEAERPEAELDRLVKLAVDNLLYTASGQAPHRAILGCTHYPLVEHLFRRHLPPFTRILSQPEVVANSLEDYLGRHRHFSGPLTSAAACRLLTTGEPGAVTAVAQVFWPNAPDFVNVSIARGA